MTDTLENLSLAYLMMLAGVAAAGCGAAIWILRGLKDGGAGLLRRLACAGLPFLAAYSALYLWDWPWDLRFTGGVSAAWLAIAIVKVDRRLRGPDRSEAGKSAAAGR